MQVPIFYVCEMLDFTVNRYPTPSDETASQPPHTDPQQQPAVTCTTQVKPLIPSQVLYRV